MPFEAYVCVFAKPPQPGQVKTRLAQTVGSAIAAQLAQAFLEDTWALVRELSWAHAVAALADGPMPIALEGGEVWSQGEGDLGARIERVLRRALGAAPQAIAIGADTPGLPRTLLEQAHAALRSHDAVLGPAEDGGFYLLGLRSFPEGMLSGVPWSSAQTCERTLERLRAHGLSVARLPTWFDVDAHDDLVRLQGMLHAGELNAPRTYAALLARQERGAS